LHVVESQFKSLADGCRFFGHLADAEPFRGRLVECLAFYYENLGRVRAALPDNQYIEVPLWNLSRDTRAVISDIHEQFGRELAAATDEAIAAYENRPAPRREGRSPDLVPFGLDAKEIAGRFSPWRHNEEVRL
jgi:hypothetical protein